MELKLNKFQTPLTKELLKTLPKEVKKQLYEYIATVPFIKTLISTEEERGYAKDRIKHKDLKEDDPRKLFNDNRIVVDITKPHILKDLDYFRERAIFFQKNGRYTNIIPNPNPKSEYASFWKEELNRWKNGLVREKDGEWIPGYLYFYWNYSPIWLSKEEKSHNLNTKKTGSRVKDFPKPWLGDYLYFHYLDQTIKSGKHSKLLKARGVGFSFKSACISPCNMYIYPGTGNVNYHLASDKTFLSGDKGVFGKVIDTLDWIATYTPLPRMRIQDSKKAMEIQLGYLDEYGLRKGLLSSVIGISLKDNPDKARGVRGKFIQYEEDGLFPHLEKAWGVNREAVEDGDVTFGVMAAGGTGGTLGASFEASEKLFYTPEAYNIYCIPNVYDKNIDGETQCGFFWGAYLNRNKCYNEINGEPDVIKALIQVLSERYTVKYNSSDANAITQKKAEQPITPQEAVMRTTGTIFPIADLKEYYESIAPKKESFLAEHYVGELIVNPSTGEIEWKPNADLVPLRSKNAPSNRKGALEIFEMPRKDSTGKVTSNRYIAGIDPIDADTGESLFSMFVMDTFTDRIVAEYSARPRTAKEAYEISLRILKFYNATANYESNLKGLFSYYDNNNALQYLCNTPQILKDMEIISLKSAYGNRAKGTNANKQVNSQARLWIADWMNSLYNEEDPEDNRLNIHRIRSLGLLEEAISWNPDGNFDRISALGMLFILREDVLKRTKMVKENRFNKFNDLSNDKFFSRNYRTNQNELYKIRSKEFDSLNSN